MPPTRATGSRRQAATQEPRIVVRYTTASSRVTWNSPCTTWMRRSARDDRSSAGDDPEFGRLRPVTASCQRPEHGLDLFPARFATVNGLTRKLLTPNWIAFCTLSLSPWPVSMMKAVLAVGGYSAHRAQQAQAVELGHVEVADDQVGRKDCAVAPARRPRRPPRPRGYPRSRAAASRCGSSMPHRTADHRPRRVRFMVAAAGIKRLLVIQGSCSGREFSPHQ